MRYVVERTGATEWKNIGSEGVKCSLSSTLFTQTDGIKTIKAVSKSMFAKFTEPGLNSRQSLVNNLLPRINKFFGGLVTLLSGWGKG